MLLGKHILSSAKHRDHIDLMKFSGQRQIRHHHVIYDNDLVEEMYTLFREIRLHLRVAQGETFGAWR